jgi:glycosyltransferase involved in cell wall biosynthesis
MGSTNSTSTSDYWWLIRKTIARWLSPNAKRRIMGRYHWFFRQVDRLIDFAQLTVNGFGEKPRVYYPRYISKRHSAWHTYRTHPPLRYTALPWAELCHWVNLVPDSPRQPCVVECEHILALARDITNWQNGLQNLDLINRLVAQDQCRFVFTYSAGLVEHSKRYLRPELWPKLGHVYLGYPRQPEYTQPPDRPFTILTIASRYSDKGVPEALQTFRVLRERYAAEVRMLLVSQAVPPNCVLPDGVVHYDTPRLSEELKAQLFQSAQVLFIPCYSDSVMPIIEGCAYGVPTLTTRIHHGDEYTQDGATGYLIDAPIFAYSRDYGTRWKTWEEFSADLERIRERGELKIVVEQAVDRLELMISGQTDLAAMGRAARALHTKYFTLEARNRQILRLYSAALNGETRFPSYPD